MEFHPPLVNSSGPWATTLEDLTGLYRSPHTGAITTRTSTLTGFAHDDAVHQYAFFDAKTFEKVTSGAATGISSLNSLGYSPYDLQTTLNNVKTLVSNIPTNKPIIISITGTSDEVHQSITQVIELQQAIPTVPLLAEINLSCPNIPNKPPPAYSELDLTEYLLALADLPPAPVKIGIKIPPYSNPENLHGVVSALKNLGDASPVGLMPVQFVTATNTLGGCYIPSAEGENLLTSKDGSGIGGLAGAAIHAISLGNVKALRTLLDQDPVTKQIKIIGIGGVSDKAGFERMRKVGAIVVGVGSALGFKGIGIFEEITEKSL